MQLCKNTNNKQGGPVGRGDLGTPLVPRVPPRPLTGLPRFPSGIRVVNFRHVLATRTDGRQGQGSCTGQGREGPLSGRPCRAELQPPGPVCNSAVGGPARPADEPSPPTLPGAAALALASLFLLGWTGSLAAVNCSSSSGEAAALFLTKNGLGFSPPAATSSQFSQSQPLSFVRDRQAQTCMFPFSCHDCSRNPIFYGRESQLRLANPLDNP